MYQLDLFKNNIPRENWVNKKQVSYTEEVSSSVSNIIKPIFFSFSKLWLNSYKIEVNNEKISKIYFQIWNQKFLVYIDYNINKKIIHWYNYTETDKDEREQFFTQIEIKNLKILWIQQKVKVWYSELKYSWNYFKHLWLDNYSLTIFLEELIKKFHTWT